MIIFLLQGGPVCPDPTQKLRFMAKIDLKQLISKVQVSIIQDKWMDSNFTDKFCNDTNMDKWYQMISGSLLQMTPGYIHDFWESHEVHPSVSIAFFCNP